MFNGRANQNGFLIEDKKCVCMHTQTLLTVISWELAVVIVEKCFDCVYFQCSYLQRCYLHCQSDSW